MASVSLSVRRPLPYYHYEVIPFPKPIGSNSMSLPLLVGADLFTSCTPIYTSSTVGDTATQWRCHCSNAAKRVFRAMSIGSSTSTSSARRIQRNIGHDFTPSSSTVRFLSSNDDDLFYLNPTLARIQEELQPEKMTDQRRPSPSNDNHHHDTQSIFIDGLAASKLGLDPYQNTRHAAMVYHELYSCPNWRYYELK